LDNLSQSNIVAAVPPPLIQINNPRLLEELGISASLIARRRLRAFSEAERLEVAEIGQDGLEHLLIPEAAAAWRRLKVAARQDGIHLFVVSAYRSIERQAGMIRRKLKAGKGLEEILAICAPPGFSEHHTGRAVDLAAPGTPPREIGFAQTTAFRWLERRAGEFRYVLSYTANNAHGYQFEPWHWCYGWPSIS
jgi:D-alanyl-D-alanine carboxypeptidase